MGCLLELSVFLLISSKDNYSVLVVNPRNALYSWKGNSRYFCLFHSEQTRTSHENKPPVLLFWQCSDDLAQVSDNVSINVFTTARHMLIISLEGNGYEISVLVNVRLCVWSTVIWIMNLFSLWERLSGNIISMLLFFCLFSAQIDQLEIRSRLTVSNFQVVTVFKLVSFACVMCTWNSHSNIYTKLSEKFMFQGGLNLNKFTCIFQTAYVASVSEIQHIRCEFSQGSALFCSQRRKITS